MLEDYELWTLKFYWKRENYVTVMCWRGVGVPSAGQTIRWSHCEMIPCLLVLLFFLKFFQLILNNTYQFIIIIIHLCYIKLVYVQLQLTQNQQSDFRDVLKKKKSAGSGRGKKTSSCWGRVAHHVWVYVKWLLVNSCLLSACIPAVYHHDHSSPGNALSSVTLSIIIRAADECK